MTTHASTNVLGKLLAPISTETFFRDYWQKTVLSVEREDPHYFDDMLTVADIDTMLAEIALPVSQVNLGMNAVGVPTSAYSNGVYVSPSDVIRLHREGNTIILRAMHLWLPRLRDLCEQIESIFMCDVQTNLYLTPANTQSSYPHWDAHDIFVLQIAGSKRWVLHECDMKSPLPSYEFDRARHRVGAEIGEVHMRAGDIAYIPRGVAHSPVAVDYSVHIALGVKVRTWADVLADMYKNAVTENVPCRAALPIVDGSHAYDERTCALQFEEIAKSFLDKGRLSGALKQLENEFFSSRRTKTGGALAAIAKGASVDLDTRVSIPQGTVSRFEMNGDACDALLNGVRLTVSREIADSFAFLNREGSCRIRELPAISDAHRVAIAQKLIDEGCVVVCAE